MTPVPYCRCRVLYIGSAIPTITKDGLKGIQQPLRERYPTDDNTDTKGIDSWLSVWSNGILLEYIEGERKVESAFHPIKALHYCAAVRYVNVSGYAIEGGGERFLPLDSPFASGEDGKHPPIFAAIIRRSTGIKVLECHAFICTTSKAANALVRCCFHVYAELMYMKLDERLPAIKSAKEADEASDSVQSERPASDLEESPVVNGHEDDKDRWAERAIGKEVWERRQQSGEYDSASISSSIVNRLRVKKLDRERMSTTVEQGAMVPYVNGNDTLMRRAGSDLDIPTYGDPSMMGAYGYIPSSPFRGAPIPMPHLMAMHHHQHHPMVRPPMFPPFMGPQPGPLPPQPFPHFLPPPMFNSPAFGVPAHFGPRLLPLGMMPPRFMWPPVMGRPRSPPEGPIITGPESVYGTLPRRPGTAAGAYEEPIYMPGNMPFMPPPQASYQPGNFPADHYDAYYDSLRTDRLQSSSAKNHKAASLGSVSVFITHLFNQSGENDFQVSNSNELAANSKRENDESTHFWDSYEANVYRKQHLNEKAFSATARSMPSARMSGGSAGPSGGAVVSEASIEILRPQTPPADYESAFNAMHIDKSTQHRTTAVMY